MDERLNILLWRNWEPLYDYPATFSVLNKYSVGGTCSQLLWHARHFVQMGHGVQVLGATGSDVVEEQVEFIGSTKQSDQERIVASGRVRSPDVICLEGAFAAAEWFKFVFPKAKIIHIGQNIDRFGAAKAFRLEKVIDVYAFVGPGQLANYCVQYPKLRHKFILIRNIVPWNWLYKHATPNQAEDHIAWVGAWGKKGLRQWAETMQQVLLEYPSYRWTLCGPCYGPRTRMEIPPHILKGLKFLKGKIAVESAPLIPLARIISSARIVLVSLGNECGPISTLDAHAMGRPAGEHSDRARVPQRGGFDGTVGRRVGRAPLSRCRLALPGHAQLRGAGCAAAAHGSRRHRAGLLSRRRAGDGGRLPFPPHTGVRRRPPRSSRFRRGEPAVLRSPSRGGRLAPGGRLRARARAPCRHRPRRAMDV